MIARVAFPIAVPGLYDYAVPAAMSPLIAPGVPVKVALRSRELWGVVVEIAQTSRFENLKKLLDIRESHWSDADRSLIELYRWIASYYQCDIGKVFKPLVRKGAVETQAKTIQVYTVTGLRPGKLTPRQRQTLDALEGVRGELTREELAQRYGASSRIVKALADKGALAASTRRIMRPAAELRQERAAYGIALTDEQRDAAEQIGAAIGQAGKPFLIHGITGSGKTHVYIELTKRALAAGYAVIILVPEISLTPQTIARFRDALGEVIAVIHSRMSEGERRDSLDELVAGRKRAVIGVRSAILAPIERVGLIIVDEEHDGSYKQEEPDPRYHARDVAVMRGRFQRAAVVLGSATPSLESYCNARTGKYHLIRLTQRFGNARLPAVEIVDMNREHQANNWTFLSRYLHERMLTALEDKRQIILLLNRRGFSARLLCKTCGHVHMCRNCSVHLVYHRSDTALKCHQCGWEEPAPSVCPQCRGEQIRYKGTGIQKAHEFLSETFGSARILRMDQDSTRRKGAHVTILDSFARGEADILLGTQMVAKGLNFPGVSLVGVLQADIGLHMPDFRASERTFQLLTQVAGRAGRSDSRGEVVIQTYNPEEPGIICARTHDYGSFYEHETRARRELRYPPFGKLMRIVAQGSDETAVADLMGRVARIVASSGGDRIQRLGPAPAALTRIRNEYRHAMVLKAASPRALAEAAAAVRRACGRPPRDCRLIVDVDPLSML
jgi:primosomal protein N' (replication factor Y)